MIQEKFIPKRPTVSPSMDLSPSVTEAQSSLSLNPFAHSLTLTCRFFDC